VGWGDTGFEPRTAGQQSNPIEFNAFLIAEKIGKFFALTVYKTKNLLY
jgi:hypothetical protein